MKKRRSLLHICARIVAKIGSKIADFGLGIMRFSSHLYDIESARLDRKRERLIREIAKEMELKRRLVNGEKVS